MGKFYGTGTIQHTFEVFLMCIRQTLQKQVCRTWSRLCASMQMFCSQAVTKNCVFNRSAASPVAESIAQLSLSFSEKRIRPLPLS